MEVCIIMYLYTYGVHAFASFINAFVVNGIQNTGPEILMNAHSEPNVDYGVLDVYSYIYIYLTIRY